MGKSYSSLKRNFNDTLSEFWHLYRHKTGDIQGAIASTVAASNEMEALAERSLGIQIAGKELLEIGAGQQMLRLKYMSTRARVTAVDYDVILQGFDPAAYLKVLRKNGLKRFAKTVLRKAAGIDRACWRELERQTGQKIAKRLPVVQGDAHALSWPDNSFDFAYSFSVFEHLDDPAKCLDETIRVLRPGGGFCISTHSYTSDSGAHDPRTFIEHREGAAYWAHLRPAHQASVRPNAYCNKLRLSEWEEIFRRRCPGVVLEYKTADKLAPELQKLRAQGELGDYTDKELLTVDLWALWKKPT
ncbi:MAG: class I SAM-dependent methyltransferase [Desulfobacterales bacterium]